MFKKVFIALMMVSLIATGSVLACDWCKTEVAADLETGVYTPPLNNYQEGPNGEEDFAFQSGYSGHAYDIEARGSFFAYADGSGQSDMYGTGTAFQEEINGGELSGAGSLTIATGEVRGVALGIDKPFCKTDNASVDLEMNMYSYQANGAYSDDKISYIGGWNESDVSAWGQTDDSDKGTWPGNDYCDLTASASDRLSGTAITGGGTLVYAHQTNTSAEVKGVTGNFTTAYFKGAEHQDIQVSGFGSISGVAQLPDVGYSTFNASYQYEGQNYGAGVAGGVSNVDITQSNGHTSVTSSATAFSGATTGCSLVIPRIDRQVLAP